MLTSGSSGRLLAALLALLVVYHPSSAVEFCEAQMQLNTQCQDSGGGGGYFAFSIYQSDVSTCWSNCALNAGCAGKLCTSDALVILFLVLSRGLANTLSSPHLRAIPWSQRCPPG